MEINNICPVAREFKDDSNLRRTVLRRQISGRSEGFYLLFEGKQKGKFYSNASRFCQLVTAIIITN